MAIVLQLDRLDWNQSNVVTLNWVQISKIKLNIARIIDGGCTHYKMTRIEQISTPVLRWVPISKIWIDLGNGDISMGTEMSPVQ